MFELLLTVCILGDPAQCLERRLPMEPQTGMMECLRYGPAHADRWLAGHPDLVLKSWRCGPRQDDAAAVPGREPFALEEIAPGVHVHTGRHETPTPQNAGDLANIGFIVGAEAVAVIDTGGSARVAQRLLEAVRAVTDKPVRWLILTHMHPDHVLGASVFAGAGATVIGHARLERALGNRAQTYEDNIRRLIGERAWAGTEPVLPDEGVEDRREIDLGGRVIELIAHPTAHTDNDLSVYDRQTGTWWVSDLVFAEHTPALDGSITGWQAVLEEMAARGAQRMVPGHGPASLPWPDGAVPTRAYLAALAGAVRRSIAAGETMGEAIRHAGQDLRGDWLLFDEFHPRNVSAAFQELEWE